MTASEDIVKMMRRGETVTKSDVMKIFLEKADALVRYDRAKGKKKTPEAAFAEVFDDSENDHVKELYFTSPGAAAPEPTVEKNLPPSATLRGYDQILAKARDLIMIEPQLTIEAAFSKIYESPAAYGAAEAVNIYKSEMSAVRA